MQYFGAMGSERMPSFLSRSFWAWNRMVAIRAGLSGLVHSRSATAAALGHILESENQFYNKIADSRTRITDLPKFFSSISSVQTQASPPSTPESSGSRFSYTLFH